MVQNTLFQFKSFYQPITCFSGPSSMPGKAGYTTGEWALAPPFWKRMDVHWLYMPHPHAKVTRMSECPLWRLRVRFVECAWFVLKIFQNLQAFQHHLPCNCWLSVWLDLVGVSITIKGRILRYRVDRIYSLTAAIVVQWVVRSQKKVFLFEHQCTESTCSW